MAYLIILIFSLQVHLLWRYQSKYPVEWGRCPYLISYIDETWHKYTLKKMEIYIPGHILDLYRLSNAAPFMQKLYKPLFRCKALGKEIE